MAAAAAVIAVLTPSVSHASQKIDGSYSINVDNAGNVTVRKAGMLPIPTPGPNPTYTVTDARSARLLKALAPASVNLDASVHGNTLKVNYVNGTATTGSSANGAIPLYAIPGATAAHHVIGNGDRVMIRDAQIVAGETWLQVKANAPHATNNPWGWVKAANVSYRIYFLLAHGPATPGATSSIPQ
jgi:hypothetical protein